MIFSIKVSGREQNETSICNTSIFLKKLFHNLNLVSEHKNVGFVINFLLIFCLKNVGRNFSKYKS